MNPTRKDILDAADEAVATLLEWEDDDGPDAGVGLVERAREILQRVGAGSDRSDDVWDPPVLLPGDVRELVLLVESCLGSMPAGPETILSRHALKGAMSRLMSEGLPPNVPVALTEWLAALSEGADREKVLQTGTRVMRAIVLSGDATHAVPLQKALEFATARVFALARAAEHPETDAAGPQNEKGSTDGIDWYDPDPKRFYSLGGEHGKIITELLADLRNAPRYVEFDIDAPTKLLFVGHPGTGKTEGARYVCSALGIPMALLRLDTVASSFVNRTPRNLRACFEEAAKRGAAVVIDELDGLGVRRDAKGDVEGYKKVTTALKQLLDSIPKTQIVIGCTNVQDAIDPSIGRMLVRHVTFGMPGPDTRKVIIMHHWRNVFSPESVRDRLVELTDGRSGDTIQKAAHDAARRAIRRAGDGDPDITIQDVHAAMAAMPREGKLE